MNKKEFTLDLAGRTITAQFTDLAEQANGSVILKCDNTVVLATAVMSGDGRDNRGWFNLTVEYQERFYASGEILGARYTRREGRPSEAAVLSARVIDRTIRPLFDHRIKNAVQVIVTVLSLGDFDPTILATNAVSLALATSNIPWRGPIGCVAMRQKHEDASVTANRYDLSTTHPDTPYSIDMIVCGRENTINMIEAANFESPEAQVGVIFDESLKHISTLEQWQKDIVNEIGKEKTVFEFTELPADLEKLFNERILPALETGAFGPDSKKIIHQYEDVWDDVVKELYPDESNDEQTKIREVAGDYYHKRIDQLFHDAALKENKRADLRAMSQVRGLYAQAGDVSPLLHGSGIFYRGGTHILSVLALSGPDTKLEAEGMEVKEARRYFHHYNFPPYSAGETGRVGGFNRRQIGHGFLAEKALVPVLPSVENFPYTMRIVSESTASNGSTSQASICGSTLALMDGGVPIKAPVAGIAMGLMLAQDDSGEYRILTDIQGPEDHHGDMDFKVAGTKDGVTAIQLDIKLDGIPVHILKEALEDAKAARLTILETITSEINAPRPEISEHAPKILSVTIKEDQIGMVIGKGGENIKALQERTETVITIEDDGSVFITGKGDGPEQAKLAIMEITKEWMEGDVTEGPIVKIIEAGAIVKLSDYADGFVHISEIAAFRVANVTDVLKEGQVVPVKVVKVDKEKGRIGLSIEKAQPGFIKNPNQ